MNDRLIPWCELPFSVLCPMTKAERTHAIASDDLRLAFALLSTASRSRALRAWGTR